MKSVADIIVRPLITEKSTYYEEDLMDDYDGEDEWKESILSHNEAGE